MTMILRLTAAAALVFLMASPAWGQNRTQGCYLDNARTDASSDLSYQRRGNRCEGLYIRRVSNTSVIRAVGLHRRPSSAAPVAADKPLQLTLDGGGMRQDSAGLVLTSLRYNTFYLMDRSNLAPGASFQWSAALMARALPRLRRDEIGLLACAPDCKAEVRTLLPVSLGSGDGGQIELVMESSVDLAGLSYTLAPAAGARRSPVRYRRLFPARVPIRLNLGSLPAGDWTVSISATAKDGSPFRTVERVHISG